MKYKLGDVVYNGYTQSIVLLSQVDRDGEVSYLLEMGEHICDCVLCRTHIDTGWFTEQALEILNEI